MAHHFKRVKEFLIIGEEVERRFFKDYINDISKKNGFLINHIIDCLKPHDCLKPELQEDFNKFKNNFKKSLITPILPTTSENKFGHWDVSIFDKKIDVKGLRKIKRSDNELTEDYHWIEFKNASGNKGWLYGEADYFAFELHNSWIMVEKNDLQKFIHEKCKAKIRVESPEEYKLYGRKNLKDVLTLVKSLDLCQISSEIIRKS
jgi:hypothetical protein